MSSGQEANKKKDLGKDYIEMSPPKGQERPADSGGETSKSKDNRAASAQAPKGTKRSPESERLDDTDKCLMNLIMKDRDKYSVH